MNGIYCYINKENNRVVYVGKDSHIDRNQRHKEHFFPSAYNKQPLNRILQKNPNKYQYKILIQGFFSDFILNKLEEVYILHFNTYRPYTGFGFNFTKGGDGQSIGYKPPQHVIEEKRKAMIGQNNPMYGVHRYGKENPMYGKKHTKESKQKMSINRRKVAKHGRNHHRCVWDSIDQAGGVEYIKKRKAFEDFQKDILFDLNISHNTLKRYLASFDLTWNDL